MRKSTYNISNTSLPPRREWHGSHHTFSYRPKAFRFAGDEITGINFVPWATEMRAWLMQSGLVSIISSADQNVIGGYTNPYTFSGGALASILTRVVRAFHDYVTSMSDDDAHESEIERLRLYNEVVLYSARFCEVVIKQLLYCMNLPESDFERKALGELLESRCPNCKKENGKKPHMLSLVGSLAHPFGLCLQFEHCAMDHMSLVNKLRNSQAAHSSIQTLNFRTVKMSKDELQKDCNEVLEGFSHMLSHLEKVEGRMLDDLAEKGGTLEHLRLNGLPPEEAVFRLIPGVLFKHEYKPNRSST